MSAIKLTPNNNSFEERINEDKKLRQELETNRQHFEAADFIKKKHNQTNGEAVEIEKMEPLKLSPVFDDLKSFRTYHEHIKEIKASLPNQQHHLGLFTVKTANEWIEQAKNTPIPKMLFSEFWNENEICILFADSNLGKSILAVQIANSISKGHPLPGFKLETCPQPVLYFDFELSAKQFEVRYSVKIEGKRVFDNHYSFNDNFKRIEINPDAAIPIESSFEEYLNQSLEKSIVETGAKILIIDNITYLKNETERAKDALPLMKHLKALKSKHGLSILALAHTPKRDLSRPITQNDLQGSKMLYNFIDSCFAIGQSTLDKSVRYIKQIKARNTAMIYDTENVIVCRVDKPSNFLGFKFLDFGSEREHLKELTQQDRDRKILKVHELKKQGMNNVQIAEQYNVSEGTIRKWLKKEVKSE
ncbi:AAA family ATPase [Algoriphagus sediminis]|uniref:AAA family ATPase n=1 Tax=Algoriphagus sediminis TaxID=3057113 RepID=A0ABT7YHG6_9BACT|nr:AAA family ATPase [Algoriphagus sediminis]MDN3205931.1 AAA family ATPase [Algoriphagus sediminis]